MHLCYVQPILYLNVLELIYPKWYLFWSEVIYGFEASEIPKKVFRKFSKQPMEYLFGKWVPLSY